MVYRIEKSKPKCSFALGWSDLLIERVAVGGCGVFHPAQDQAHQQLAPALLTLKILPAVYDLLLLLLLELIKAAAKR